MWLIAASNNEYTDNKIHGDKNWIQTERSDKVIKQNTRKKECQTHHSGNVIIGYMRAHGKKLTTQAQESFSMGVATVYSALRSSPHFKGAINLCEIFNLWKLNLRIKSCLFSALYCSQCKNGCLCLLVHWKFIFVPNDLNVIRFFSEKI